MSFIQIENLIAAEPYDLVPLRGFDFAEPKLDKLVVIIIISSLFTFVLFNLMKKSKRTTHRYRQLSSSANIAR
jgi:hypothetical protein